MMATRKFGQGSSSSTSVKIINGDAETGSTRSSGSSIEILEHISSKVALSHKTADNSAAIAPAVVPKRSMLLPSTRQSVHEVNGISSRDEQKSTRSSKDGSVIGDKHASVMRSPSAAKKRDSPAQNNDRTSAGGSLMSKNSRGGPKSALTKVVKENGTHEVNGELDNSSYRNAGGFHRRENFHDGNSSKNSSQRLEEEVIEDSDNIASADDEPTESADDTKPYNGTLEDDLDGPKYADPLSLFPPDAEVEKRSSTEPTYKWPADLAAYTRLSIDGIALQEARISIAAYQKRCRDDPKYEPGLRRTIDKIDQTANRLVWAMCAEHNNNDEMITCFWKQCDPNEDSQQFAALAPHTAAKHGNLTALLLQRESSADFDIKDADQKTPIFHAIAHGKYPAVLFLLQSGASVNAQDKAGDTPLHVVMYTMPETLHGRDRNTEENLALASKIRTLLIKELLEAGANPNIRNHEELTPLLLVMMLPHVDKECIKTFFTYQTAQLPVDPNVQGPLGMTALHIAARYARPTDGKSLAAFNSTSTSSFYTSSPASHLDPLSPKGTTPPTPTLTETYQHLLSVPALLSGSSECAEARHDREKLIEWIKQSSCDVQARDRMGRTALHVALHDRPSAHLNILVLLALAEHGCDVTSVCEEGYAAFDLLSHFGDERCNALRKALLDANEKHVKLIRAGKRPSAYDFSRGLSYFPMPVYNRLRYSDSANLKPNSKTIENESENEPSFVYIQGIPATDELKLAHATLYFQEHLELVEFLSCNCGRDSSCGYIDCDTCLISALHPQTSSLARGARLVARDPHRKLTQAIHRQVNGYKGSRELDYQRNVEWDKWERHQRQQHEILDSAGVIGGGESVGSGEYYRLSDVRWFKQLDAEHQRRFGAEVEARTNSRQFHYTADGRLRAFAETNTLPAHMQPMSMLNFDEIIMLMWEEYAEQLRENIGKDPRIVRGPDRIVGSGSSCGRSNANGLMSPRVPSSLSSSLSSSSSSSVRQQQRKNCCVTFAADDAENMQRLKKFYANVQDKNDPEATNVLAAWMLHDVVLDVPRQPFFIRECNSLCLCSGRCANRLTQRRDAEAELRIERSRKVEQIDCSGTHFGAVTLDFDTLTERLLDAMGDDHDLDDDDAETLVQKLSKMMPSNFSTKPAESRGRRAMQHNEGDIADDADQAIDKTDEDRDQISESKEGTPRKKSRIASSTSGSQSAARRGDGVTRSGPKHSHAGSVSAPSMSADDDDDEMEAIDEADDDMPDETDPDDADSPRTPTTAPPKSAVGSVCAGDVEKSVTSSYPAGGSNSVSDDSSKIRLPSEGWVVKPVKPLRPGQFICFYAGIVRNARQDRETAQKSKTAVSKLSPSFKKRFIPLDVNGDLIIDNSFYGNASRLFLMSARLANVEAVPVFHDVAPFPKVAFFAKRWIFPHEPLIFDPDLTHKRFAQDWPRTLMAEALRIRRLYPFYLRDKDVRILKDQARWNRLVPHNMMNIAGETDDVNATHANLDNHKSTRKSTAPFALSSASTASSMGIASTATDDDDDVTILESNEDEGVDVDGAR